MRKEAGQYRIYMNVGYDLNEEQLRHYFEKFGRVKDVYLPKHPSGRNRGFGFTSFEDEDSLLRSLVTQEHIVEGRPVKTNRAGPRPTNHDSNGLPHPYDEPPPAAIPPLLPVPQQQLLHAALQPDPFALGFCSPPSALVGSGLAGNPGHGRGPRIYVGNIPDSLSEEEIRQHFMRWGQVKDIYFPGKRGQKRVNYCFITFDTAKSAQRACSESERSINGKGGLAINLAEQRSQAQPANSGGSSGPHSGHQSPISAVAGSLPAGEFSSLRMAGMQHPTPIAGYGEFGGGMQPNPAGLLGNPDFMLQQAAEQQATAEHLLRSAAGKASAFSGDPHALLQEAMAAQGLSAATQGRASYDLSSALAHSASHSMHSMSQSMGLPAPGSNAANGMGGRVSSIELQQGLGSLALGGLASPNDGLAGLTVSSSAPLASGFGGSSGFDLLAAASLAQMARQQAGYGYAYDSLAGGHLQQPIASQPILDGHGSPLSPGRSGLGLGGYGSSASAPGGGPSAGGSMYMAPGGPFPAGSAGMAQFGRGNGLPAQFTGAYNGGASHLGDGILAAASAGFNGNPWSGSFARAACKVRTPPPYPGSQLVEGF